MLSALTTLETLYDAVVQQQSSLLSSFSAMQSADKVCKCIRLFARLWRLYHRTQALT